MKYAILFISPVLFPLIATEITLYLLDKRVYKQRYWQMKKIMFKRNIKQIFSKFEKVGEWWSYL